MAKKRRKEPNHEYPADDPVRYINSMGTAILVMNHSQMMTLRFALSYGVDKLESNARFHKASKSYVQESTEAVAIKCRTLADLIESAVLSKAQSQS